MLKRLSTLVSLLFAGVLLTHAEEAKDAVYVWASNGKYCYQLSSMPTVTYQDGCAVLTLNSSSTPELIVELKNDATLMVAYGIYDETAIENVEVDATTQIVKDGKYIHGGKLIIVKDGQHYNINGLKIK